MNLITLYSINETGGFFERESLGLPGVQNMKTFIYVKQYNYYVTISHSNIENFSGHLKNFFVVFWYFFHFI